MANNQDIVNAVNNIKTPNTDAINQNIKANATAISKLGEGIDVDFDVISKELKDSIKSDLDGMGGYFRNIITNLTDINNKIIKIEPVVPEENKEVSTEIIERDDTSENDDNEINIEDVEWEIVGVDSNIKDTTSLTSFKKPGSLIASGFSLLANVFDFATSKIIQALPQLNQVSRSDSNKPQIEVNNNQKNESISSKFSNFLQDLIGPLQSVATATLTIAAAIGILSLIPISGEALGSVAIIYSTLIGTFFILDMLSKRYIEYQAILDPENKKEPGNLIGLLDSVTNMITKMSLSFGLMLLMTTILQPTVGQVFTSLGMVFGLVITSIFAANALAKTVKPTDLKAEDGIFNLINSISNMVLKLSIGILLVSLLPLEMFWSGFGRIIALLTITELSIVGMNQLMKATNTSAEEMNAFSSIIKSMQSLLLVMGILVIVLGILPLGVITQGMITVALLFALIDVAILALAKTMEGLNEQGENQIKQASSFITSLTITIGVLSLLVIVLGLIPPTIIAQGLITITALFGIMILSTYLISKIKITADTFTTLGMVALLTITIALTAALITTMIPDATQTMMATLALGVVAVAFLTIGGLGIIFGLLGKTLPSALAPAMVALGIISLFALTLAAAGLLITTIIPDSEKVINATKAVTEISFTFIKLSPIILALGILAIPLGVGSALAIISIASIVSFISSFNSLTNKLTQSEFNTESLTSLETFTTSLQSFMVNILALSPVIITAASTLPRLILMLGITRLSIGSTILSLKSINKKLNDLDGLQTSTTLESGLTSLSNNIASVVNTITILEGFKGLTTNTVSNIKKTLRAINDISKTLSTPETKTDTSNIDGLANSLEKLAQTEPGLAKLAEAIKEVAQATQSINDLDIDVKQSIEVLSKREGNLENMQANIQKANESKKIIEDNSQNEVLNTLNGILSGISDLGRQVSQVLASNQRLAVATEANYSPSISNRS